MQLFVDTSVWSQAFRRDSPADSPEVSRLSIALESGEPIFSTGLILQELLQGFSGPKSVSRIVGHFDPLPLLTPRRSDHIEAAILRNKCRRRGVQVGTIDAILAQLCISHKLTMLSVDADFTRIAMHCDLQIWQ